MLIFFVIIIIKLLLWLSFPRQLHFSEQNEANPVVYWLVARMGNPAFDFALCFSKKKTYLNQ